MERTYGPARRVVKGMRAYLLRMPRHHVPCLPALLLALVLAIPRPAQAQGLPEFGPLNPVASSRSGLYFQPFREPEPGRWRPAVALDYASLIEYNRLDQADYVLDSEVLRLSFGASRDLGRRTFLALSASVGRCLCRIPGRVSRLVPRQAGHQDERAGATAAGPVPLLHRPA